MKSFYVECSYRNSFGVVINDMYQLPTARKAKKFIKQIQKNNKNIIKIIFIIHKKIV